MLVRYWATGVPAKPPPSEASDVQRLMVSALTGRWRRREERVGGTGRAVWVWVGLHW